ncbi:MAG: transketolase [Planctomycetota bacterium]|nr:transketolase [Planctomycetota bacterium]MDI6787082.1 transketolase [Planctomycetota bacterium]
MSLPSDDRIEFLRAKAKRIRQHIIRMLGRAGSGHPGGSLSAVEILVSLYFHKLRINPEDPTWPDRDRFLMSKGHAAPVWYATLAEAGFFPLSELNHLRKLGSILQGHPDMKRTPGVEMSSGSLGQGLSVANGIALAGKIDKTSYRVYVLIGDGECQEGQIWEAAMAGAHYKLDNLCAILDFNGFQIDGAIESVMSPLPFAEKFSAFGWNVITVDGHNIKEIIQALERAETVKNKPTIIIARTIKGKGVSFMENRYEWHGKAPDPQQTEQALKELQ